MIIVEVAGGLGNQMFQYALYQKFLHMGKEVRLDLFSFCNEKSRPFELDLFGLQYETIAMKERKWYIGKIPKLYQKMSFLRNQNLGRFYAEKLDVGYQPEILSMDNVYLSGYWQCELYFKELRDKLIEMFTFPIEVHEECRKLLNQIEAENATAVHVRRGDYLIPENSRKYGNICTESYYQNAMKYIREKQENTRFYFFSNDPEWVREHLSDEDSVIVQCNEGKNNYLDMYLMSKCKNNIIANSSFSWWGAWLNQYPEKIVISPERWFSHLDVSDAICKDWIKISG